MNYKKLTKAELIDLVEGSDLLITNLQGQLEQQRFIANQVTEDAILDELNRLWRVQRGANVPKWVPRRINALIARLPPRNGVRRRAAATTVWAQRTVEQRRAMMLRVRSR